MQQAVIVAARRTPVGAFGKSLRDLPAAELGRIVLEALMADSGVDPCLVEEVVFGHGYVHGGGLNSARISSQRAGFPLDLSLIHISEPTRLGMISYAVFCLKKKKKK